MSDSHTVTKIPEAQDHSYTLEWLKERLASAKGELKLYGSAENDCQVKVYWETRVRSLDRILSLVQNDVTMLTAQGLYTIPVGGSK